MADPVVIYEHHDYKETLVLEPSGLADGWMRLRWTVCFDAVSIPRSALPQMVAALVAEMSAEQIREVQMPVVATLWRRPTSNDESFATQWASRADAHGKELATWEYYATVAAAIDGLGEIRGGTK